MGFGEKETTRLRRLRDPAKGVGRLSQPGGSKLAPTRMSTLVDIPRMEVALTPTRMSTLVDIPKMEAALRKQPCFPS